MRIYLFGERTDVFSLSESGRGIFDPPLKETNRVILSPSLFADASAKLCFKGRMKPCDGLFASYCASVFFLDFRGLPLSDIEIESEGKIYVACRVGKSGEIGILQQNCKVLYANKPKIIDEIAVNGWMVDCENRRFLLTKCSFAEHFSDQVLARFLWVGEDGLIDCAAAFSLSGKDVTVRHLSLWNDGVLPFALAVATVIFSERDDCDEYTLHFSVGRVKVLKRNGDLVLIPLDRESFGVEGDR